MKKIIFIIYSMENSGGTERVVSILSNNLSVKYDVTILTFKGNKSFYYLKKKILVRELEGSNILVKLFDLRRLLIEIDPMTIIGISMTKLNIVLGLFFKLFKFPNVAKIAAEHTSYNKTNKITNFLIRKLYSVYKNIIVLTNRDKVLMSESGFEFVQVIENPLTFNFSDIKSTEIRQENIVLTVGSLKQGKGLNRMIKIWSLLPSELKKSWKLYIVGDGDELQNLKKMAKEYEVGHSVCFFPATKEVIKYYLQSKIFVMTSYKEGLPMVMLEAMQTGLPIIAYDCPTGPRELIENSINGYLIKDGDKEEFIKKLLLIMQDDLLREELSTGSKLLSERFQIANIIKKWDGLLDDKFN